VGAGVVLLVLDRGRPGTPPASAARVTFGAAPEGRGARAWLTGTF
jgi:hypothetical protein